MIVKYMAMDIGSWSIPLTKKVVKAAEEFRVLEDVVRDVPDPLCVHLFGQDVCNWLPEASKQAWTQLVIIDGKMNILGIGSLDSGASKKD